jgi:16S rRNA U1498 N3-methylase RsmE
MGEAVMFGFNLKAIATLGAAAVIATSAAYVKGRWDGHSSAVQSERAKAVVEAAIRIANMEKINAEIRALPADELCRLLAADSGLPKGTCD